MSRYWRAAPRNMRRASGSLAALCLLLVGAVFAADAVDPPAQLKERFQPRRAIIDLELDFFPGGLSFSESSFRLLNGACKGLSGRDWL
jgi:hypothetical protein